MSDHPYVHAPASARWSKAVGATAPHEVDPVVDFPFRLAPSDKVATAGSCFAQHIARHLQADGYNYYVVEDGHPIADPQTRVTFGYGLYSARYGNIYSSRQLRQLFERAYGVFQPQADWWTGPNGKGWVDPFRPTIQPGGFSSVEELRADRAQHLGKVRQMLETLDVFVFTLGLTETWVDRRDGAAFPVCPGVSGGTFEGATTAFVNLTPAEVVEDMTAALTRLKSVNPRARVILTVSPVPLAATALARHVLTSTTYSKAVLRVAAEALCASLPDVAYFPSYEIVTGSFNRGAYFAPDLRQVTEEGVSHVMRLFARHATTGGAAAAASGPSADEVQAAHVQKMSQVVQTLCDEEMLDRPA